MDRGRRAGAAGTVAAAVLAGGASRRMGGDKATLLVGGAELALNVVAAAGLALDEVAAGLALDEVAAAGLALDVVAGPVALVAPPGHPAAALAERAGVRWLPDPEAPLPAIVAALRALEAPYLLVLAADHPELRPGLLALLLAERSEGQAVVCRRDGRLEPLVAVYQRAPALAAAGALLGSGADRSVRGLLGALRCRVVEEPEWRAADPAGASFVDLDEPADLAAYLARRNRGSGPASG